MINFYKNLFIVIFICFTCVPSYGVPFNDEDSGEYNGKMKNSVFSPELPEQVTDGTSQLDNKNELLMLLNYGNYKTVLKNISEEYGGSINDSEVLSIKIAAEIKAGNYNVAENDFSILVDFQHVSENSFALIAQHYFSASKLKEAMLVCQEGLIKNGGQSTLYFLMGLIHQKNGRHDSALVLFDYVLNEKKESALVDKNNLVRATVESYMNNYDYSKAYTLISNHINTNQDPLIGKIVSAKHLASQGEFIKAISMLGGERYKQENIRNSILKAQMYILSGEQDKAIALLKKIEGDDHKGIHKRTIGMVMALAQLLSNDPEGALKTIKKPYGGKAPTANLPEATIHMALGDKVSTTKALSQGPMPFVEISGYSQLQKHLGPRSLGPTLGLLYLCYDQGYLNPAIDIANEALTKFSDNIFLHLILAESYRRLGKYENAITEYKKLTDIMPESFAFRLQFGQTLEEAGMLAQARGMYAAVVSERPDFLRAQLAYGKFLEKENQWENARSTYELGLNYKPKSPYLLTSLAWVLIELQDHEAFTSVLNSLNTIEGVKPASILHVDGWRLYQQKEFSAAVDSLSKANEQQPGNPELYYHLGMAMLAAGQRNEAENLVDLAFLFPEQRRKYQDKTRKVLPLK